MLRVGTETWGCRREAVPQRRGLLPACSGRFSASPGEWPWCHCSLTVNEGRLPKAPGLGDARPRRPGDRASKEGRDPRLSRNARAEAQRSVCGQSASGAGTRQPAALGALPDLIGKLTCREKARRAGMGMSAAMKKAVTLLMEVRATLAPVRLRHSPVLS